MNPITANWESIPGCKQWHRLWNARTHTRRNTVPEDKHRMFLPYTLRDTNAFRENKENTSTVLNLSSKSTPCFYSQFFSLPVTSLLPVLFHFRSCATATAKQTHSRTQTAKELCWKSDQQTFWLNCSTSLQKPLTEDHLCTSQSGTQHPSLGCSWAWFLWQLAQKVMWVTSGNSWHKEWVLRHHPLLELIIGFTSLHLLFFFYLHQNNVPLLSLFWSICIFLSISLHDFPVETT